MIYNASGSGAAGCFIGRKSGRGAVIPIFLFACPFKCANYPVKGFGEGVCRHAPIIAPALRILHYGGSK